MPGLGNLLTVTAFATMYQHLYNMISLDCLQCIKPDNYSWASNLASTQRKHMTNCSVLVISVDSPIIITKWFLPMSDAISRIIFSAMIGSISFCISGEVYLSILDCPTHSSNAGTSRPRSFKVWEIAVNF